MEISTPLFLILFLVQVPLWMFFLRYAGISLLQLSIPSVLITSIIIFQYIGHIIVYFNLDPFRSSNFFESGLIIESFLYTTVSTTLLIVGFLIGRLMFGRVFSEGFLGNTEINLSRSFFAEKIIILFLYVTSILVMLNYITKIGFNNIALFSLISINESGSSLSALRSSMTNSFSGGYHWYKLFFSDCLMLCSGFYFVAFLRRRSWISFMWMAFVFFTAVFAALLAAEKSPLLWLIVYMLCVFVVTKYNGKIKFKSAFVCLIAIIMLAAYTYVFVYDLDSFLLGSQLAMSRIFTGQLLGSYHYVAIFPEQVDFLLGKSFPNPASVFPWEPYPLAVNVFGVVFPEVAARGVTGSMPTIYWAELYANFNIVGVLIIPVFIGLILFGLNRFFTSHGRSPIMISIFVWAILHFRLLSGTSFSRYLFDINLIAVLLIIGFSIIVGTAFKKMRIF